MAKVLVTGAAGFLGSNLCDRLLKDGQVVVGMDNYYTGSEGNIAQLQKAERFSFLVRDITKPMDEDPALQDVEAIYNMACPASPPHYQRDPLFTLDTSYLGVKNLCELARKCGARILQASTSEVYGDPLVHPQVESYWGNVNCFGLRSCYDEGKRVAETLLLEYARKYGIGIKVVRIFNTYGPRMRPDDGRIVSNFIVQALRGETLTVYGDGSQTRSFCYVDDLVDALVRMMSSAPEFIGPVNIGNPGEFTVRGAAELIKELTGSASSIVYRPLPSDDPKKRKPDISLAISRLGWQPSVSFRDGAARTIEYFRDPDGWAPPSRI
jgi:nucleoside-diphosphate-sugar epimerase